MSQHTNQIRLLFADIEKAARTSESALVMEDSLPGATAATRAGIQVVLIPDQSFTHHFQLMKKQV